MSINVLKAIRKLWKYFSHPGGRFELNIHVGVGFLMWFGLFFSSRRLASQIYFCGHELESTNTCAGLAFTAQVTCWLCISVAFVALTQIWTFGFNYLTGTKRKSSNSLMIALIQSKNYKRATAFMRITWILVSIIIIEKGARQLLDFESNSSPKCYLLKLDQIISCKEMTHIAFVNFYSERLAFSMSLTFVAMILTLIACVPRDLLKISSICTKNETSPSLTNSYPFYNYVNLAGLNVAQLNRLMLINQCFYDQSFTGQLTNHLVPQVSRKFSQNELKIAKEGSKSMSASNICPENSETELGSTEIVVLDSNSQFVKQRSTDSTDTKAPEEIESCEELPKKLSKSKFTSSKK